MDNPVFAEIQAKIEASPVVLFMKGNPMFPQCGCDVQLGQCARGSGNSRRYQSLLRLADHSAALRQGRVRWRLRYRDGDVPVR